MNRRDYLLRILDSITKDTKPISVIGSMNADIMVTTGRFPLPGETIVGGELMRFSGGKSANQAASAARLGANVHMYGAVGEDDNATFLLDRLHEAGVNTDDVKHVPGPSGTTIITVDGSGENTIIYLKGANGAVDKSYISEIAQDLTNSSVLGLCFETDIDTVGAVAFLCHRMEIPVVLNDSPFIAHLDPRLVSSTDILLVNEHEMAQLLGMFEPADGNWEALDWKAIAMKMHNFGFNKAAITLGSAGSMVIENGEVTSIPGIQVRAVDTTGCGDSFMGTILAGTAAGLSLADCAQLATCVAAYAATHHGAQSSYGTREDIAEFIKAHFPAED